jgi:hypothetical protein
MNVHFESQPFIKTAMVGNRSLIFNGYFIGKTDQIENLGKKINPLF